MVDEITRKGGKASALVTDVTDAGHMVAGDEQAPQARQHDAQPGQTEEDPPAALAAAVGQQRAGDGFERPELDRVYRAVITLADHPRSGFSLLDAPSLQLLREGYVMAGD